MKNSKQSDIEKIFSPHFARFFKANGAKEGVELLSIKAKQLGVEITQNALLPFLQVLMRIYILLRVNLINLAV